jgi:hypothetical protein
MHKFILFILIFSSFNDINAQIEINEKQATNFLNEFYTAYMLSICCASNTKLTVEIENKYCSPLVLKKRRELINQGKTDCDILINSQDATIYNVKTIEVKKVRGNIYRVNYLDNYNNVNTLYTVNVVIGLENKKLKIIDIII